MSNKPSPVVPMVLVVAPPGYYRASLVALLGALPQPQRVLVAADLHQANVLTESIKPDTVLLAVSLRRSALSALQPTIDRMRGWWPQARIVLLTDKSADARTPPIADARLRYNASAGDLVELFGETLKTNKPHSPVPSMN